MKKNLLPIHILILFLLLLTAWSSVAWNGTDVTSWFFGFRNFLLLVGGGFCIRFLIRTFIEPTLVTRFEHRLITTLILFLLFDSLLPWWVFLLLGAITELSQYFLRTPMGPVFNPAALGGLLVAFLGYFPSWWGVNPVPRISLFGAEISVLAWITALGAAYVVYRYRKLPVAGSALVALGLSYALLFQTNPTYILLEGTLLFFIFVMISEPKTSPVVKRDQYIYGALAGILFSVGLYFHFVEASFIALLVANLYTSRRFLFSLFTSPQTPAAPVAS